MYKTIVVDRTAGSGSPRGFGVPVRGMSASPRDDSTPPARSV
ncbi:hypothetical protein [Methanosphaerula subterraneus]